MHLLIMTSQASELSAYHGDREMMTRTGILATVGCGSTELWSEPSNQQHQDHELLCSNTQTSNAICYRKSLLALQQIYSPLMEVSWMNQSQNTAEHESCFQFISPINILAESAKQEDVIRWSSKSFSNRILARASCLVPSMCRGITPEKSYPISSFDEVRF